ncbi:MAG: 2-oxo-4-hydroxy-4-carboxy-5-ureidoimidazoline decarboxylase [Pyrinomonadaceae bacterium]
MEKNALPTYKIYKNLAALNELDGAEAEAAFRECCGLGEWCRRMAEARPFALVEDLFTAAEQIWFAVSPEARLEALQAEAGNSRSMAAPEDSNIRNLYEARFGIVFIVDPTGRSDKEIADICRARVSNSAESELSIAASELITIIQGRLAKLLER